MNCTTGDASPSWNFDEDALSIAGTFVEITVGSSPHGSYPIAVLDVAGGERQSIWLWHFGLRAGFAEELVRRHEETFRPGERIVVARSAEKTPGRTHDFWRYTVTFLDAEPTNDARILGVNNDVLAAIGKAA